MFSGSRRLPERAGGLAEGTEFTGYTAVYKGEDGRVEEREVNRLYKTKTEWCDYVINPIKGLCPVDCKDNQGKSYCYARRMYKRFKWNPEIRFVKERLIMPSIPSRFFIGSTMELFGDWIKDEWMEEIFMVEPKIGRAHV